MAFALSAMACSGSGSGGGGVDAGLGGGSGAGGAQTGGSAGVAGSAGSAGATDGGADAAPIDPSKACDLPLDATGLACKSETPTSQPKLGGLVPEGIYDRTLITSPFPASTCDATSSLLLQNGLYKMHFGALGGPFISGGSYVLDAKVGRLIFTSHCGDNDVGYFYEYNEATQMLTLFPDDYTGWVYQKRP